MVIWGKILETKIMIGIHPVSKPWPVVKYSFLILSIDLDRRKINAVVIWGNILETKIMIGIRPVSKPWPMVK